MVPKNGPTSCTASERARLRLGRVESQFGRGGTIAFGICTYDALGADASVHVNEGTWCYTTSGEASHGIDMREVPEATDGDRISVLIDTTHETSDTAGSGGYMAVFVNDKQVVRFEDLNSDPMMKLDSDSTLPVAGRGVRPFFCLGFCDVL